MITGSCMCGGITYNIKQHINKITHCHCTTCRKAHGSAFSSVAVVKIDCFDITSGQALLKGYASSPDKTRYFCSHCGSQIYAHREGQDHYIFRMGTLDDNPNIKPSQHIWVSLKAPWYDIDHDSKLKQFETWSDDGI